MASPIVPYWRANVPTEQWPDECPEFLLGLSERDQELVGRADKDYHRLTWPEVKTVIGNIKRGVFHLLDLPSKRRTNLTASCGYHPISEDTSNTTSS